MNEQPFRAYLKKRGKKPHVVDNLVAQVAGFETYLVVTRGATLATATPDDVLAYTAHVEEARPGSSAKAIRGIALYYAFSGDNPLAVAACKVRDQHTAATRRPFALRDFRDIDSEHVTRLAAAGITNVDQMLARGDTPAARQHLAAETGIPLPAVRELVELSDLARIPGLKGVRARLYHAAGVRTPAHIAAWEPEPLRQMLAGYVAHSGFDGTPPLTKEVASTVAAARALPSIVKYET